MVYLLSWKECDICKVYKTVLRAFSFLLMITGLINIFLITIPLLKKEQWNKAISYFSQTKLNLF